jgi:hypothetical protein
MDGIIKLPPDKETKLYYKLTNSCFGWVLAPVRARFFYFRACEYSTLPWAEMKQARKDGQPTQETPSFHGRGGRHF